MTRKTGKMAVKARQLMRSAKLAKYKRELAEAGVSLSLPKPSAKARREKEEELRKLYLELFTEKQKPAEEEPAGAQEPIEQAEESKGTGEPTEQAGEGEAKEESEEQAGENKRAEEPQTEKSEGG
jgi:hypothetical protein